MKTKLNIGMKSGKVFHVENVTFENSRKKASNFQEWVDSLELDGKGHLVFNDLSVAMSEIEYLQEVVVMINLSEVSTKDLSEELERRQGVITVQVEPYEKIEVGGIVVNGPAIVLINQD